MSTHFVYLVRHGLAAEQGPEFPNDDDRPLTSEGVQRMRVQVLGLRALDVRLDRVLTSPLVRAAQTAEILAAGLGCAAPLVTVDALRPGGRYDALLADLRKEGFEVKSPTGPVYGFGSAFWRSVYEVKSLALAPDEKSLVMACEDRAEERSLPARASAAGRRGPRGGGFVGSLLPVTAMGVRARRARPSAGDNCAGLRGGARRTRASGRRRRTSSRRREPAPRGCCG